MRVLTFFNWQNNYDFYFFCSFTVLLTLAPKWHEAAAVLGAIAIFCGLAQHIINVLSITMKRMADKVIYKFISAGCSALAGRGNFCADDNGDPYVSKR